MQGTKSVIFAIALLALTVRGAEISTIRIPDDGIAPQAAVDSKGVLHLTYFKETADNCGDLFHVRSSDDGKTFSSPILVNSHKGSAISVRTARIALGKDDRLHVLWNGSKLAQPKGPKSPHMKESNPYNGTPLLYTRLNAEGTAFEPQRNLMQTTFTLDGAGSISADGRGNVYAVWHASNNVESEGESRRALFMAVSRDNGQTFESERRMIDLPTGACGCCHVQTHVDSSGNLYAIYRGAESVAQRDTYLVWSTDQNKTFSAKMIDAWRIGACPMSTAALTQTPRGMMIGWQTQDQVYFASLDPSAGQLAGRMPAPGNGKSRKHPILAANRAGDVLAAWTEGMGFKRGGAVLWQQYDAAGKPKGSIGTIAKSSGPPAVVTLNDGSFVLIH